MIRPPCPRRRCEDQGPPSPTHAGRAGAGYPVHRPAHRPAPGRAGPDAGRDRRRPRWTSWPTSAVPASIRDTETGRRRPCPPAATETEVLAELRALAARNTVTVPMLGLGYAGTITPPAIRRNVLENPAWYTAYTPYQPEISQGRLEALLTFQTMVADLTGLPVAGASLLDEATAAAEAMTLLRRAGRSRSARFVVDADTLPQTIDVLRTRAEPLGIELVVADLAGGLPDGDCFGVLLSYPGASGAVRDPRPLIDAAHAARRAGRGGRRPARAHPAHPARRARGRRRGGQHPALRGAAGLRRPARRLPVGAGEAGPPAARPAGRDVPRRRRPPRAAARPADPRAAHPPGEGHLQHLHRAGAAGRGGRLLRRVPRPGRAAPDRPCARTGWPRCWPPGCAPAGSRWRTTRSSTPCRRVVPGRAEAVADAAHDAGHPAAPGGRRHRGHRLLRGDDRRPPRGGLGGVRGDRRRRRAGRGHRRRAARRRCCATAST